jgi:PPOX class probable F420-dependent enzyme
MPTPKPDAEQVRAFLDRELPAMLGVVGTLRGDGSPHVVPVWYRWDGERVHIWTHEPRAWVQHLLRDNRAAFSVQEEAPPYSAVLMRGRVAVVTSDDPAIDAEIRAITRRYIAAAEVDEYLSRWTHLRTIVSMKPDKITFWGRGY